MNFQSLKGMIDTLVKTFKCPECNSEVFDSNIDIIGAAGNTINIDIECNNCGKHSMVKTEVLSINLTNKGISSENLEKLRQSLIKGNSTEKNMKKSIVEKEILDLNKDLKKNKLNVSDLFGK